MKEIELTQGYKALVDDEDFERINKHIWCIKTSTNKRIRYAHGIVWNKGGVIVRMSMHRFILDITNKRINVDHIDGNGLNNQKSNLRICTHSQNNANRGVSSKKKSSKYKGVFPLNIQDAWKIVIIKDGIKFEEKGFKTPEEAAKAYDKKAKELFGEYARLNFPD